MSVKNSSGLFLFIFLFSFLIPDLKSQTTSSPYSRYGVGDVQSGGFPQNFMMGGTGIGVSDSLYPVNINVLNPASYPALSKVVFESGILSTTYQLKTTTTTQITNNTSFSHLSLGYRISKYWGQAFGIMPFSGVGYNINNTETHEMAGEITYKYEGSGGINQIFFGNGFRPFAGAPDKYKRTQEYREGVTKRAEETDSVHRADSLAVDKRWKCKKSLYNFSFGFNALYYFGALNNTRRVEFSDPNAFHTKITQQISVSDLALNSGILYTFQGKKTIRERDPKDKSKKKPVVVPADYTIGLTYALPAELNAKTDVLSQTYKLIGSYETVRDTVENFTDQKGNIALPAMIGAGFSMKAGYRFLITADVAIQQWENLKFFGDPSGLKNSFRASAGFRYRQGDYLRSLKYGDKITYYGGARYTQTMLELKNTTLTEYAVSLGVGLPLPGEQGFRNFFGGMNIGLELGQRGTTSNGLIRESFGRISIGFLINDKWFNTYKIN